MKRINLIAVLFGICYFLPSCSLSDYDLSTVEQNIVVVSDIEAKSSNENIAVGAAEEFALKSGEIRRVNLKGVMQIRSGIIGPGSKINLEVEGTGTISHMGRSKISMNKTVTTYSYPDPPQPWNAYAKIVLTSAMGDELHFYYNTCLVDRSETPMFIFKTECVISGGTGRYKNVGGIVEYNETFDWSKSIGTLNLTGTLYYY